MIQICPWMEGRISFWSEIWRAILMSKKHLLLNAIRTKYCAKRSLKSLHWSISPKQAAEPWRPGQSYFTLLFELTEEVVATWSWIATHPPKLVHVTQVFHLNLNLKTAGQFSNLNAAFFHDQHLWPVIKELLPILYHFDRVLRLLKAQTYENFISFPWCWQSDVCCP